MPFRPLLQIRTLNQGSGLPVRTVPIPSESHDNSSKQTRYSPFPNRHPFGNIDMSESFPERLSRDEIRRRQLERLRNLLDLVLQKNLFYRQRFAELDLDPQSFRSPDDLRRLPLLTKQELVNDQNAHPPFGTNLSVSVSECCRLHQTSGTTGKPMRWLDTPASWNWFMDCWAQIYRLVGIRKEDVFAFPFSFGPFIGFWAAFEGAQRLGNLSLTLGGMSSEARLKLILEMNASVVCCTPTYALRLAETAEEMSIDLAASAVRMLIVAGEPGGAIPSIRERIESAWGTRVIDHWGMTDIGSLGVEPVDAPGGLNILETECIAEILNPETLEPANAGEIGELVITNLGRWSQPVIRYRTGDLVRASTQPCPSGTSLLRLEGGILGRADDMVTIRGNNFFPSSMDAIMREFAEIVEYRMTLVMRKSMPHLKLEIEPRPDLTDDESIASLLGRVNRQIKDRLQFQAEVTVVPPNSLPRFELKGKRFVRE